MMERPEGNQPKAAFALGVAMGVAGHLPLTFFVFLCAPPARTP